MIKEVLAVFIFFCFYLLLSYITYLLKKKKDGKLTNS